MCVCVCVTVQLELAAEEQEQDRENKEEEEPERYSEYPTFPARPPSPQPPFTSTTFPTAPDTPQSNNARGRPSAVANERRERAFLEQTATNLGQEDPFVPDGQPRPSDPYRPSVRMPPPPGAYLPHMYQPFPPDGRHEAEKEEREGVMNEGMAPGMLPPTPSHPPYFNHPLAYHPSHHHYPPWVSPTPHLGGHNMSFPYPKPSPGFNVGPTVPPPPPVSSHPNFRLSWPPPRFPGTSPFYPGHASHNSSFAGFGLNHMFGSSYLPPHVYGAALGESRGSQRPFSPSGVTGVSMQVQPPSSPPSAPSMSNLPHSSSSLQAGPDTGELSLPMCVLLCVCVCVCICCFSGSGLLPQTSSGTIPAPATTSTQPSFPKSQNNPHTHTSSASNHPPPLLPWEATDGGCGGEARVVREGERKKVAASLAREQDRDSLSSLPLSVPDASKLVTCVILKGRVSVLNLGDRGQREGQVRGLQRSSQCLML